MFTQIKINVTAKNLPNIKKGSQNIYKQVRRAATLMVNEADTYFQNVTQRELKWHPWRGGFGNTQGTYIASSARQAQSKINGYLSTGVPFFPKMVGNNMIWGFGDLGRANRLRTRDGKQNLVRLIEYGAKSHPMPIPTRAFGKPFRTMFVGPTEQVFWKSHKTHPGFAGKHFYRRVEILLRNRVGVDVVADINRNAVKYMMKSSFGSVSGAIADFLRK